MAYTPTNNFDAPSGVYEAPYRLEVDFDQATTEGVSLTVGAQTRKPIAAVGVSKSRDLVVSGQTRPPSLLAIVGKVDRVDVAARTRAPTLAARVVPVPKVSVWATTRKPRLDVDLAYDPNLLSDVVALTEPSWATGSRLGHGAQIRIPEAVRASWGGMADWSQAIPEHGTGESRWIESPAVTGGRESAWRDGHGQRGGSTDRWLGAPKIDRSGRESWRGGHRLDGGQTNQWHPAPPHYATLPIIPEGETDFFARRITFYPPHRLAVDFPGGPYGWAQRPGRNGFARSGWNDGRTVHGPGLRSRFGDGERLPSRLWECWEDAALVPFVWRVPPPYVPPPWERDWSNNLCLIQPLGSPLDLGFYGCGWTPEPGTPGFIIPLRVAYLMHHEAALYRIDPETLIATPLPCESFSIQSRFTDTVRRLSASLFGTHVAPLLDSTTAPIALRAEVNGIAFVGEVDTYQEEASWNAGAGHTRSVSVTAYSPTFRLGGKWRTPRSFIEPNARTMAQLAEQELADTGFTVTWNATDWLVPGGVWSYSNLTPIQAIAALAASAGAYIISDRVNQTLRVEPVYHVLPWDYGAATPDIVIPRAAIERWTKRNPIPQQANGVWIGSDIQDPTLYHVVIEGTDGSLQADDVRDPLMVTEAAVRARGGRIIGALQPPPIVSQFTIPMDAVDFPLFELGQLVEVQDMPGGHVRGIVRGVDLSVAASGNGLRIRQTVTLGEEPTNTYQRLSALIRPNPILLGTVSSVSGNVATLSTSNAGTVTAMTGAFSVSNGDRVWAQDVGRGLEIVGSAPSYGAGVLIEI